MSNTHAEHLTWVRQRALEYVELGQLPQAVSSAVSELRKHEDWNGMGSGMPGSRQWAAEGLATIAEGEAAVRAWIGRIA